MNRTAAIFATGLILAGTGHAIAQDSGATTIPFEGGNFTIAETAEMDKTLTFDGQLLAQNFVVSFDRFIELGETKVALFSIGDGGNQCGPSTLIAWRPKPGGIESDFIGEGDCGTPPAAATGNTIYFVPYLLPGASAPVRSWSPEKGIGVAGTLRFMPQPGTVWAELDPSQMDNIIDAFSNEAVYTAASTLLGDALNDVATGLVVGGGAETLPSGVFFSSGCVPHSCGISDAFMAVDQKAKKLYFAQQSDRPEPDTWPEIGGWPADVRDAMKQALTPPQ